MSEDNKDRSGFSMHVSIGKEIDAALGDAIRGLFKRPAEEAGNLLADGIGILADRVRRKREINLQLGTEEVRKKLETSKVDVNDISSPKEEELHLLLTGLSLTDDENVRDMWAGLFAKALDPNSGVSAERPFISVLQSLSPMDVKVIYFLAFILKTEKEMMQSFGRFMPKNYAKVTAEEQEKMTSVNETNLEIRKKTILAIKNKADEYGLKPIVVTGWSENLLRQGVIERPPLNQRNTGRLRIDSFDERGLLHAFDELNKKVATAEEIAKYNSSAPKNLMRSNNMSGIQLEVQLSSFGKRLAEACGLS